MASAITEPTVTFEANTDLLILTPNRGADAPSVRGRYGWKLAVRPAGSVEKPFTVIIEEAPDPCSATDSASRIFFAVNAGFDDGDKGLSAIHTDEGFYLTAREFEVFVETLNATLAAIRHRAPELWADTPLPPRAVFSAGGTSGDEFKDLARVINAA